MTDLPKDYCLGCKCLLEVATDIVGDEAPESGDITICLYCGHIMAFDEQLKVRELTSQEMHKVAGHRIILAAQAARRKVLEDK
jgi:hypothetical protein